MCLLGDYFVMKNNSALVQHIFDDHMSKIVNVCLSAVNGVVAIVLYGGYGRDEGAWVEINGKYAPYNDYDILLVINDHVESPESIEEVKRSIVNMIDIKWVDVGYIYRKDLHKPRMTVYWYDLIHGSKVIYGDNKILDTIPHFHQNKIKKIEAEVLFFTRLWPFIGVIKSMCDLGSEESLFFRYQMTKSILSIADILLIMRGKYVSSYKDKVKNALLLIDDDNKSNHSHLLEWAIIQKLTPSTSSMAMKDVIKLQNQVAHFYAHYMLIMLSKIYRKKFLTINQFCEYYSSRYLNKLMVIIKSLVRPKVNYRRIFILNIVQLYILSSILNEVTKEDAVKKCIEQLNKIDIYPEYNFDSIRLIVADERVK